MTLKTQFKKIYGAHLEKYGFKYGKDFKCFVKYDEKSGLVYFINYRKRRDGMDYALEITLCVVSIYVYNGFMTSLTEYEFGNAGEDLSYFFGKDYPGNSYIDSRFIYTENDDESMNNAILRSAEKVKEIVLPTWDKLVDLDSYINYRKTRSRYIFLKYCDRFAGDSLVFILADNHCDYKKIFEREVEQYKTFFLSDRANLSEEVKEQCVQEQIERFRQTFFEDIVNPRDKVFNDPELLKEALAEAARRKEQNEAILKANKIF